MMLKFIGNHREEDLNGNSEVTCKIYDARGYYAALGNKMSGKGF